MKAFIHVCLGAALAVGVSTGADPTADRDAKRGAAPAVVKATGTIEPEEVIDVGAQVNGFIKQLGADPKDKTKPIDFNSVVKKGTVLTQLEPAGYEAARARAAAALRQAEASLRLAESKVNLAERELVRVKKRHEDKKADAADVGVAEAALQVAKDAVALEAAAVTAAKAELRIAEINLDYCTIRSPVDGVIIDRRVNVGQAVIASLNAPSLFLIAKDLKRLQVWAAVKEADITRITSGQKAKVNVDAYPKRTFEGRVAQVRLNATLKKDVVTYTVVVDVDNRDGKLLPYMTAQVEIEAGEGR